MKNTVLCKEVTAPRRFTLLEWVVVAVILIIGAKLADDFINGGRAVDDQQLLRESKCVRDLAAERIRHGWTVRNNSVKKYREQCEEESAERLDRLSRIKRADALTEQP